MSRVLPIYETFHSWQGEGCHLGRNAYFIRTHGCPVRCSWCDSAGTWHPDWAPDDIEQIAVEELARRAKASGAEFSVITGGEPAVHDLAPLTSALAAVGVPVHLETSGAFSLRGRFDWITVSPKRIRKPLEATLRHANEVKIVVDEPGAVDFWVDWLRGRFTGKAIWLHPEWSQRNNPEVLKVISRTVTTLGDPFRAGFQIHRLYGADELDDAVRPPVPLGGNPGKGY